MNVRRYKIKTSLYIVLLIPFLELLTFEQLAARSNALKWHVILTLYSLFRMGLTLVGFLYYSRKGVCRKTTLTVSLFVFAENCTSFINGSLYINYTIGSVTLIGLVLVCDFMIRKSRTRFLNACIYYLVFLSLVNIISVLIWPNGFFNARIKDYAIYFLGSKNTAFFYYILLFYYVVLKDVITYKKPRKRNAIWIVLFIISSYLTSSASAMILLTLTLIAYIVWCKFDWIMKHLSFKLVIPLIIISTASIIFIAPLRNIFTPVFNMVGRDATVTGRDVLWLQAFQGFMNKPITGNGINTSFTLATGVLATHAHSFFLDMLAKFGIIGFLAFCIMPISALKQINKQKDKELRILNNLIISVLFIHSVIDHLMIYNFVLFLATAEGVLRSLTREGRIF